MMTRASSRDSMEPENKWQQSATAEEPAPVSATILAEDSTLKKKKKKMWLRSYSSSSSLSCSSSSSSSSSAGLLLLVFAVIIQLTVTGAISCSMCDSTIEGSSCLYHPPRGTPCNYDNCITVLEYRERKLHSVKMSCTPVAFPATCVEGKDTITQDMVEMCYWTCNEDDCNRPRRKSLHHILQLLSK